VEFSNQDIKDYVLAMRGTLQVRNKVVDLKHYSMEKGMGKGTDASASDAKPPGPEVRPGQVGGQAVVTRAGAQGQSLTEFMSTTVFIGGLPRNCTDEELHEQFSQFDPLVECTVKRNEAGYSRGFGFVKFQDLAMCNHVLSLQGGLTVRDKVVEVRKHEILDAPPPKPKPEPPKEEDQQYDEHAFDWTVNIVTRDTLNQHTDGLEFASALPVQIPVYAVPAPIPTTIPTTVQVTTAPVATVPGAVPFSTVPEALPTSTYGTTTPNTTTYRYAPY
jgi:hypothetical protein